MYALFRVGHRRIKAALEVETVTRRSTTATFANTGGCSCAGSTEYHEIHVAKLDEGARQSSGGMLGYARPAAVPRPASVLGGDYEFSGRVDRYVVSGAVALDSRGGAALSFRSASGWIGWIPRALAKQ